MKLRWYLLINVVGLIWLYFLSKHPFDYVPHPFPYDGTYQHDKTKIGVYGFYARIYQQSPDDSTSIAETEYKCEQYNDIILLKITKGTATEGHVFHVDSAGNLLRGDTVYKKID